MVARFIAGGVETFMGYYLREGLHHSLVDGQSIFLDLKQDRYFMAPPRLEAALSALALQRVGREGDCDDLAPLVHRGLLVERVDAQPSWRPAIVLAPATGDAPDAPTPPSLVARAVLGQIAMGFRLRCAPLAQVIQAARARKSRMAFARSDRPTETQVFLLATAYRASSKYLTSDRKCMRRSLALFWDLAGQGHDAELVIGVCVRPFGAHCWVQRKGLVLNDAADEVRRYTPILTV